jgi:hypothetical protein
MHATASSHNRRRSCGFCPVLCIRHPHWQSGNRPGQTSRLTPLLPARRLCADCAHTSCYTMTSRQIPRCYTPTRVDEIKAGNSVPQMGSTAAHPQIKSGSEALNLCPDPQKSMSINYQPSVSWPEHRTECPQPTANMRCNPSCLAANRCQCSMSDRVPQVPECVPLTSSWSRSQPLSETVRKGRRRMDQRP